MNISTIVSANSHTVHSSSSSSSSSTPHYRVGWSTRMGELQGPVGYDKFSYAYGDVTGTK